MSHTSSPLTVVPDTVLKAGKRAMRIGRRLPLAAPLLQRWRNHARTQLLRLMPKHSVCAEIGVWKGEFSQRILEIVEPSQLFLIDPWSFAEGEGDQWHGGNQGHATDQLAMDGVYRSVLSRLGTLDNVTVVRDTSTNAVTQFDDELFDWIYIDGNHSYECVRDDLEKYLPKVKPHGYVTGDDYFWAPAEEFPIKRAVQEVVRSGRARLHSVHRGQWILNKI